MADESFQPVFQVSEFNEVINQHLALLGEVTIEGELTRLDVKNGRLIFGSLKDKTSSLDIFSMSYLIKNFRQFEPGMLVRVTGTPGVYKGSTKFRLYVTSMVPQGEGALQVAFEKLKAQLAAEGLFAPERKRSLPEWPQHIGLITAKDSSAYFDLVKILSARMQGLTLKLLPVNVQGREAVPTILKALAYCNQHPHDFDVLIMARGGGSLEDLAAFNDETIARAVFSSRVPIVSAIGHEDNWSLTDYIADLRASTPSNAAELVVRDRREVLHEISGSLQFMHHLLIRELTGKRLFVSQSASTVYRFAMDTSHEVNQHIQAVFTAIQSYRHQLDLRIHDLAALTRLIRSLDYQETLNRGYSITKNAIGKIIKSSWDVQSKQILITQLASGIIKSHAD